MMKKMLTFFCVLLICCFAVGCSDDDTNSNNNNTNQNSDTTSEATFKCNLCDSEKTGEKFTKNIAGTEVTICADCNNQLNEYFSTPPFEFDEEIILPDDVS